MYNSYLEVNIMSLALLFLILFHSGHSYKGKSSDTLINRVIILLIITTITDIVFYFVDLKSFPGARSINIFSSILYFSASSLSSYFWFFYTCFELNKCASFSKLLKFIISFPAVALILMTLLSPTTHWIFYVDDNNEYFRGSLNYLQIILTYIYIVASSLISIKYCRVEVLQEKKRHYWHLSTYPIIPLAGGVAQGIILNTNIAMPATVVAITMLYLDNIKQETLLDPLTRLNNRGQFDNYLEGKIKSYQNKNLFLVFFDIDNFKEINDSFGHIEGDKAIKTVAQTLQNIFSDKNSFLARYGGDEFAVIITGSEERVISDMQKVNSALDELSSSMPFHLSVSFGYSRFGEKGATSPDELIISADKKMYLYKQSKNSK